MVCTTQDIHETIDKSKDDDKCLTKLKSILSKLSHEKAKQICEEQHNPSTYNYQVTYKYEHTGDALCRALEKGHHKVMKYLLDEIKVNPNLNRNNSGVRYGHDTSTCLYGAVSTRNHAAMKILLSRGADPKLERNYQYTYYNSSDMPKDVTDITKAPICEALENKDLEAARLLLEHGCGDGVNNYCVSDPYTSSVESETNTNAIEMAKKLGGEFVELFKKFNLIQ